jgi:hypothetical protein
LKIVVEGFYFEKLRIAFLNPIFTDNSLDIVNSKRHITSSSSFQHQNLLKSDSQSVSSFIENLPINSQYNVGSESFSSSILFALNRIPILTYSVYFLCSFQEDLARNHSVLLLLLLLLLFVVFLHSG